MNIPRRRRYPMRPAAPKPITITVSLPSHWRDIVAAIRKAKDDKS